MQDSQGILVWDTVRVLPWANIEGSCYYILVLLHFSSEVKPSPFLAWRLLMDVWVSPRNCCRVCMGRSCRRNSGGLPNFIGIEIKENSYTLFTCQMLSARSAVVDLNSWAPGCAIRTYGKEVGWFLVAWSGAKIMAGMGFLLDKGLLLFLHRLLGFPWGLVYLFNLFQMVNTTWRSFKFLETWGMTWYKSGTPLNCVSSEAENHTELKSLSTKQVFPDTALDVSADV